MNMQFTKQLDRIIVPGFISFYFSTELAARFGPPAIRWAQLNTAIMLYVMLRSHEIFL